MGERTPIVPLIPASLLAEMPTIRPGADHVLKLETPELRYWVRRDARSSVADLGIFNVTVESFRNGHWLFECQYGPKSGKGEPPWLGPSRIQQLRCLAAAGEPVSLMFASGKRTATLVSQAQRLELPTAAIFWGSSSPWFEGQRGLMPGIDLAKLLVAEPDLNKGPHELLRVILLFLENMPDSGVIVVDATMAERAGERAGERASELADVLVENIGQLSQVATETNAIVVFVIAESDARWFHWPIAR